MISLLTPPIELLVNQAIKLDPDAQSRLKSLEGKIIKIILTDLNSDFYIVIEDSLILVKTELDKNPNAELKGSAASFFNLAMNEKGSDSILKAKFILLEKLALHKASRTSSSNSTLIGKSIYRSILGILWPII